MAIKITPINVSIGPVSLDLGNWSRDCSKLQSIIEPPRPIKGLKNAGPPNTFSGKLSGGFANSLLNSLGDLLEKDKKDNVTSGLTTSAPGFEGTVILQIQAQPLIRGCENGNQAVGWAFYLKLHLEGKASSGFLAGGGGLDLSFGPFGEEWEDCDCNKNLELKTASAMLPLSDNSVVINDQQLPAHDPDGALAQVLAGNTKGETVQATVAHEKPIDAIEIAMHNKKELAMIRRSLAQLAVLGDSGKL